MQKNKRKMVPERLARYYDSREGMLCQFDGHHDAWWLDDDCNRQCQCPACGGPIQIHESVVFLTALIADIICEQNNLTKESAKAIISVLSKDYYYNPKQLESDVAFIYPFIKDEELAATIFGCMFGDNINTITD